MVVVGPGLGVDDWSAACLRIVLESHKPLVVDADALNLLATDMSFPRVTAGSVLTPHPGEAARLAKVPVSNIEADRLSLGKSPCPAICELDYFERCGEHYRLGQRGL